MDSQACPISICCNRRNTPIAAHPRGHRPGSLAQSRVRVRRRTMYVIRALRPGSRVRRSARRASSSRPKPRPACHRPRSGSLERSLRTCGRFSTPAKNLARYRNRAGDRGSCRTRWHPRPDRRRTVRRTSETGDCSRAAHQLPFRAHRVERLQQQRPQQSLRRDRSSNGHRAGHEVGGQLELGHERHRETQYQAGSEKGDDRESGCCLSWYCCYLRATRHRNPLMGCNPLVPSLQAQANLRIIPMTRDGLFAVYQEGRSPTNASGALDPCSCTAIPGTDTFSAETSPFGDKTSPIIFVPDRDLATKL